MLELRGRNYWSASILVSRQKLTPASASAGGGPQGSRYLDPWNMSCRGGWLQFDKVMVSQHLKRPPKKFDKKWN